MRRARTLSTPLVSLVLMLLLAAPLSFASSASLAQGTPKKKGGKGKPAVSASASAAPTPEPPPPPPPPPEPAPSAAPAASVAPAPEQESKASDEATEDPRQSYKFLGARYRGTIIPKFIENVFVNEGATIYSSSFGFEYDMRKEAHSTMPWITYTEYGTGDILFFQKGKPDDPANYSVVNSSLKALYVGLDELWTTPIADHLEFEYGFGVGLGFVFGSLQNNWVYLDDPNGKLVASNGRHYTACPNETQAVSCAKGAHQNADVAKVGGYVEPSWFGGGSVPVLFPYLAVPSLGVRYKPSKLVVLRFSTGFSITGFWFGLGADYGLEEKKSESKATMRSRASDVF